MITERLQPARIGLPATHILDVLHVTAVLIMFYLTDTTMPQDSHPGASVNRSF